MQSTNGQASAVPSGLKQEAVSMGVWDSATAFSGRSDEDTLLSLKTMTVPDLQSIDLREYRDRLSASDYEALVVKQADIESGGEKMTAHKMADSAVDYYIGVTGNLKPEKAVDKVRIARFKELFEARLDEEKSTSGKLPDWKRQREIADEIVKKDVIEKKWWPDKKVNVLSTRVDSIPATMRADIEQTLIEQGKQVNEANVLLVYQQIMRGSQ
jgi:hypothetical protein